MKKNSFEQNQEKTQEEIVKEPISEEEESLDLLDYYEKRVTGMIDPEHQMDERVLYRKMIRIEMDHEIDAIVEHENLMEALLKLEEGLSELHDLIAPFFSRLTAINPDSESDFTDTWKREENDGYFYNI